MNIYCFSTLSFAKLQFKSVINKAFHKHGVASFTDAWIETFNNPYSVDEASQSHLLQMRGLKRLANKKRQRSDGSHLLQMRGLKLSPGTILPASHHVASFTDAWIETHLGHASQTP